MADPKDLFAPQWTPGEEITVRIEHRAPPFPKGLDKPPEEMTPYQLIELYAETQEDINYFNGIIAGHQEILKMIEPYVREVLQAHGKSIAIDIGASRHYIHSTQSRRLSVKDRSEMIAAIKALPGWTHLLKEDYNHASLMKKVRDELKDAGTTWADAGIEDILTILPKQIVEAIDIESTGGMEFKRETDAEHDKRMGRAP